MQEGRTHLCGLYDLIPRSAAQRRTPAVVSHSYKRNSRSVGKLQHIIMECLRSNKRGRRRNGVTNRRAQQGTHGDARGFFLRMFAKAVAKHLEKYPCFNKFLLLCTDSLDNFDSDTSCNVPIPIAIDSSNNPSTVSYKTSTGSTILTSSTRKDSVSSRHTVQKPALVAPVSSVPVSRDSTSTMPRVNSTPPLPTIYGSVSVCRISEIAPGANHFRIQTQINGEQVWAMLNSGATGLFISKRYAECAKLPLRRL